MHSNVPFLGCGQNSMLTENAKSGVVATYSHISKPNTSRKRVFFILFSLSGVVGQSSIDSAVPGGRGVVAGEQEFMLKHFRRCSQ